MNNKDRAVLYGMAIGDGCLTHRNRLKDGKYPYSQSDLILGHGPKQKDYLEFKRQKLLSILGGNVKMSTKTYKVAGKEYLGYQVAKTNPYFRQMHSVLYKSGKKYISKEVLSYLDEESVALWYMDDGSIGHNKNNQGEITSLHFELHTQCNTEQEANDIRDWFNEKFNLGVRSSVHKGRYNIRGGTQATLLLCHLVEPYIVPCMMYKISPAFRFIFRKSARRPHVDEDIVRTEWKHSEV